MLAATPEPALGQGRRELTLLAVFSWSVGVFLYGAVGIFVAARMLHYPLRPEDFTPPYRVAMGATAITVLAGACIVEMANAPMVAAARRLVAGTSVVFWAFGSWLIAPLIAAGIWRHVVHHIPLRYEASLWSVVFPLGMYGVGGDYLGQADRLPPVEHIGDIESWIALAVWMVTFVAILHHLVVGFGNRMTPGIASTRNRRLCHRADPISALLPSFNDNFPMRQEFTRPRPGIRPKRPYVAMGADVEPASWSAPSTGSVAPSTPAGLTTLPGTDEAVGSGTPGVPGMPAGTVARASGVLPRYGARLTVLTRPPAGG